MFSHNTLDFNFFAKDVSKTFKHHLTRVEQFKKMTHFKCFIDEYEDSLPTSKLSTKHTITNYVSKFGVINITKQRNIEMTQTINE